MADFLQLHLLTAYGPSNLNRDDTGRPKSVVFGGAPRLRVSSQSLKRAWRESETFEISLKNYLGYRTKRIGERIHDRILARTKDEAKATTITRAMVGVLGENAETEGRKLWTEQLVFISPEEEKAILDFAASEPQGKEDQNALSKAQKAVTEKDKAKKKTLRQDLRKRLLNRKDNAADIAMFGRMLADDPKFNREAAVQVAHAITTHRAVAEDDYYTAVDDLKSRDEPEDAGAAFVDVQEFGAGVFYLYVCVDRGLLLRNLGDAQAAKSVRDASLAALVEASATVGPRGKQASFASRARAIYVLSEKGEAQPRSLAAAFLKPISGEDHGKLSVEALESFRDRLDTAYGSCAEDRYTMNCMTGDGTLAKLIKFSVS